MTIESLWLEADGEMQVAANAEWGMPKAESG
jgi:hypothetical protein